MNIRGFFFWMICSLSFCFVGEAAADQCSDRGAELKKRLLDGWNYFSAFDKTGNKDLAVFAHT